MSDPVTDAVVRGLHGMEGHGPEPLLDVVTFYLRRTGETVGVADLVEQITSDDPNGPARVEFTQRLGRWDAADPEGWAVGTVPHSESRRRRIVEQLDLGTDAYDWLLAAYPLQGGAVVIADELPWDPWYTDEVAMQQSFYWTAYRDYLKDVKELPPSSVADLDATTFEVVRRLADPMRPEPYQSKGLVVGHVQSGKTAHFAGTIAKAVDAGYRLVIVLTGTIELLRGQTQRRLDMELVGRENLLGGRDPADPEQARDIDYVKSHDRDWKDGRFVSLGGQPHDLLKPGIRRLTSADDDYKALRNALGYLDFRQTDHLAAPSLPLFDPKNLPRVDVRLAVVKKNASVLAKIVKDLKAISARLDDIPTLIIDDEADEASVNTRRPKGSEEERNRTAINRHIAELLKMLPRAQYVGYTATPFANVFVDPDDEADIFPKDFIVSLTPPAGYMGGRQFHDLNRDPNDEPEADLATSNERAFVRGLYAPADDDTARDAELRSALDAYVLSGAIKLYRASAQSHPDRFRHHTMLVHESRLQDDQAELADAVRRVWKEAGYSSPAGMRRLHELWRDDFAAVSAARAPHEAFPAEFTALRPFIGEAVGRISRGRSPVVVVNGDKDLAKVQDLLDFQADDVWKILVGGAKLSRGFTVEGLTTTYYTRRATSASTLMQMGRWFGYRSGYGDLVRLFIGRAVPAPRSSTVDLYTAFEGIVRDEEEFRAQLRQYQGVDEGGRPRVRPIDVPPLVYQSVPWLPPTARTKMFNARLMLQGVGGRAEDFLRQDDRSPATNAEHFEAMLPLLTAAGSEADFFSVSEQEPDATRQDGLPPHGSYRARYGIVSTDAVHDAVARFHWTENYDFTPSLEMLSQIEAVRTILDWLVIMPVPTTSGHAKMTTRSVSGHDVPVSRRARRRDRAGFVGADPKRRDILEIVAGGHRLRAWGDRAEVLLGTDRFKHIADDLLSPTRGAILLNFVADAKDHYEPARLPKPAVVPGDIATVFTWALPYLAAPAGRVAFSVRVKGAGATIEPST
ncbi:Z1 domain-containing protein [Promicromonospora umidemergens]|uniref:Putative endonuclease Z1 domain-containing protein n=1 Tax=Promicromonospora umidemergens TaxID=629679 RepID=A0ABP8X919_9MICO|nr:Z1 domain-containing protein [Promicromonospora umidemergens]MCP2281621.1 Z1 domain-containing protein [Promicromonospora umidemergens]